MSDIFLKKNVARCRIHEHKSKILLDIHDSALDILMTMIKDKMRNNDQMVPVKCSNKLDIRILKPGVNRYLALSSKNKWLLKWSIFLCCRQYVKLHGNILYIAKLVNAICCKMDLVNVIYILATYKSY